MKRRLIIISCLFVLSFATMMTLSFTSLRRLETLIKSIGQVEKTYEVLSKLDQLELIIKDLDRWERGYMITKDSNYLLLLSETKAKLQPMTNELKRITRDNELQHQNVIMLRSFVVARLDHLRNNIAYVGTVDDSAKLVPDYFYQGRAAMQQCIDFIQKMRRNESDTLRKYNQTKLLYQQIAISNIKYLYFGFAAITLLLFILMINALRKRFRAQEDLQIQLIDLKRSHNELEQIAFAASHDLQEPLRKIQIFHNQLKLKNKDWNEDSKLLMERINNSVTRMQELIEDLADLTNLVGEQGEPETADLNVIINDAISDLSLKIDDSKAKLVLSSLPTVCGYPAQLQVLFKALLDNSLKFRNPETPPEITVIATKVDGSELLEINENLGGKTFFRISISDNGIGFNNKFMHKIFLLFQRLHNQQSDYEGKGTGLAIAQRVMANHKGYILAHGHPNAGATFKLYFPV